MKSLRRRHKNKTNKTIKTNQKHYRHRSNKDINAIIDINAIKHNVNFLHIKYVKKLFYHTS